MSNSLSTLTTSQLKRAVVIKEKIDDLNLELAALLGETGVSSGEPPRRGRPPKGSKPAIPARPAKRKLSDAGRAAISKAAKERWARDRAKKKV